MEDANTPQINAKTQIPWLMSTKKEKNYKVSAQGKKELNDLNKKNSDICQAQKKDENREAALTFSEIIDF